MTSPQEPQFMMPSPVRYAWVTLPKALCKKAINSHHIRGDIAWQEILDTYLDGEEQTGEDWRPLHACTHERRN
jgi:hypothetical protein